MAREGPVNEVVVGLLSFLIAWILDTVNMVLLFFQFELKMAIHAACIKKKHQWSEQPSQKNKPCLNQVKPRFGNF